MGFEAVEQAECFLFPSISQTESIEIIMGGRRMQERREERWNLPLILPTRLMEDVFLPIDGENAIFHNALPILSVSRHSLNLTPIPSSHHPASCFS